MIRNETQLQQSKPLQNEPLKSNETVENALETVDLNEDVPILKLFKNNLSYYPDFKNKLTVIELDANEKEFISQLEIDDLIQYAKSNDKLSLTSVVVFVNNELESFTLKKKSGMHKKEGAVRLLTPVFDGNKKVADEFVENFMLSGSEW